MTQTSFADLGVSDTLVAALADRGIITPFPVQTMTIPDALTGIDVCGKAKTGSGKTLAFGLPMVMLLKQASKRRPHGMVLVPTRELCLQVAEELKFLARPYSLNVVAVYGGASMSDQRNELGNADIVVATPGRLIDFLERGDVSVADVSMVCLDEADQMADMGFLPQVDVIIRQIEVDHQSLLFSATLDGAVDRLVKRHLKEPVYHEVESDTVTVDTMSHRFIEVHYLDKPKAVAAIAENAERILVFVHTKRGCDKAAEQISAEGVIARALHGDLPQSKRERVLASFAEGKTKVLVATNVAARGLHIDGVDIVIHYDLPKDYKTYLHRSGRTARAGGSGLVVTFVEWNQMVEVRTLQKEAEVLSTVVKMFSNDPRLKDLEAFEPPPFEQVVVNPLRKRRRR